MRPSACRHRDRRDAVHRVKGRKSGWRGEDQTQTGTQPRRLHGRDQYVQDHERRDTGYDGRDGSANDPRAT